MLKLAAEKHPLESREMDELFGKVRLWPAWKSSFSPVPAHIQAHQPLLGWAFG